MRHIGTVSSLWRYPVSSLGGELLSRVEVNAAGIQGDRRFCLFDLDTGEVARPETSQRWRPALFLTGSIDENGATTIRFPNMSNYHLKDADLRPMLKAHFGFDVGVGQYSLPGVHTDADFPFLENRYEVAPLHLLTSASLKKLQAVCPQIDERRFRPSLVVDSIESGGFLESEWSNSDLLTGDVALTVTEQTKRCGMTLIAQPGLDEDPEILRTIVRQNRRQLGVYCNVKVSGTLSIGMNVFLPDAPASTQL